MSNSGRIAKNTFYLYIRSLFVLFISLYTSRVVLRELGVVDYGIFNIVGGVIGMLAFLNSNMRTTYLRYFNVEMGQGNDAGVKSLFHSALAVQLILAAIIVVLAESVGLWFVENKLVIPAERMDAAFWVYQSAIASFLLTIFSAPFGAAITAYERMGAFAVISIIDAVLKLGIVLLLPYIPHDKLITYALLMLLISLLNIFFYFYYCKKRLPIITVALNWNKENLRSMFSFSGWSIMDLLSYTLISQGINIVLNLFFGPVVNAARGISYQVHNAVNQFIHSFQISFRPQLTKSYASGDYDYMKQLFFSGTKISYYLIFTLSLPIILETPYILHLWLGENVPDYTVVFTRLVLLTAFVSAFANPTSGVVYATGRIKWFSIIVSGLNLMIIPIAYLFLWLGYGPVSAFVVCFVMAILVQLTRIIVTSRLTVISLSDYFLHVIMPTGTYSLLTPWMAYAVVCLIPQGIGRLALTCVLSVISSFLLVWLIGLNRQEKRLALSKLKPLNANRRH